MQSDNPDIKWALDLLAPDPLTQPNFFSKYWLQIPSLFIGPAACSYVNHMRGFRPLSRIYYHVGVTASLLLAANAIDKRYAKKAARRDAIMRDYIIRHPEDFPPPERKKYGEVFLDWVPIR